MTIAAVRRFARASKATHQTAPAIKDVRLEAFGLMLAP